jgi:hypothetical protein
MVFYKQYNCRFGQAFQAIQLLIYYGQHLLVNRKGMLEEIIQMCMHSMKLDHEVDSCEGVLLLHSLVMSVGNSI